MALSPNADTDSPLDPFDEQAPEILKVLEHGLIEPVGQVLWGSNYTFLVRVTLGKATIDAIYKPAKGERPLWDFPHGTLVEREAAAYLVSSALAWNLVPPTLLRKDGPAGPGSLQLYIEADPEQHYFTLDEAQKQRLRPLALFDILINNADRKGGHILLDANGRMWSIDHGVCFHVEPKLRTVVWDFIGEPIHERLLADIRKLYDQLSPGHPIFQQLVGLLEKPEVDALKTRASQLLSEPVFPGPGSGRPYPWPLV